MYVFIEVVHESYMVVHALCMCHVRLMYVFEQHVHGTKILVSQFVTPLKMPPCTCLRQNSKNYIERER